MKKAELLARIEALEARIRTLETRPLVQQWWPTPGSGSPTVWPNTTPYVPQPLIVTCDGVLAGPGAYTRN